MISRRLLSSNNVLLLLLLVFVELVCSLPEPVPALASPQQTSTPSKLHFVQSCHFDVGYADTAANIVNRYFDKYYAASMHTSEDLRQLAGKERLVFLTHTYLVSLYMDCPPAMGIHCPTSAQKQTFMEAVKRGDIVWHAMPFNSELELLDVSMVAFSLQLTHDLDTAFGRNKTITMSQRDVPGTTRSIIPLLKAAGVEAITVGVNPGSMPPAVPDIFNWHDPVSGETILAMWHAHGYGGMDCCKMSDSVVVAGADDALMYNVRVDNSGPPSLKQVQQDWATVQKLFPQSEIVATDYDSFVRAIQPHADQLSVYDKEIGDTWIYGVPSDHFKTAAARVMMAARTGCLAAGHCSLSDNRVYNFSRLLIKASEHTWGLAYVGFLNDNINFKNDQFHPLMQNQNYVAVANSWREQRDWGITYALQALEDHPLAAELEEELALLRAVPAPNLAGYFKVSTLPAKGFTVGEDVLINFSSQPFSISHLSIGKRVYASTETATSMASLLYQSFTQQDFEKFMLNYLDFWPAIGWDSSFGKPGLVNVTGIEHQEIEADLVAVWRKNYGEKNMSSSFLVQLAFPAELVRDYGAPADVWLDITVSQASLQLSVMLLNKTPTRLPESIWLQFKPNVANTSSMMVDKIGEKISVFDVGSNGSKHTHGVGSDGVTYASDPGLNFLSKHVPIVCIGKF
eukprot:scpid54371/ scgid0629/ 